MTAFAGLGLVLVTLGIGGGPLLRRGAWGHRLPKVATFAWLGVLAGAVAAAIGMVAIISTARHGLAHRAAEWLVHCWHDHDTAGGTRWYVFNAAVLTGTLTALGIAARRYRRTLTHRRRHRDTLAFVVRASRDQDDVCVLDHPVPVVYCVPARTRPIVVSSGALQRLDDTELQAALAHERAHLRHRHHLLLTVVDALAVAFGWLPTFREARDHVPLLLEMAADDAAARSCGRETVAIALRKLAIMPSPITGLAAGGAGIAQLGERLARLESSPADAAQGRHLVWLTAMSAIAVPLLISAAWISVTPRLC